MLYDSESGAMTIAVCGDTMLSRRLAVYREAPFLALRDLLRSADVAFTNLEGTARHYHEGNPSPWDGTFMTTEPHLLEELKWFGINLVSCANNHAYDYGDGGVLANLRHLDAAGLVHAGTGRNEREARAPAYLDTPQGRVALVAATASFDEGSRAGAQRPDMQGKPGVSGLGHSVTCVVPRPVFETLQEMSRGLGLEAEKARRRRFGFFPAATLAPEPEGELRLLGRRFVAGDEYAVRSTPNQRDLEEILRQVAEARRQADWVIVSIHSHEMGGASSQTALDRADQVDPADFVRAFTHHCIDEGAHVVVGHGYHMALGMELYRNRPIFFSLADFILQNETVRFFPGYAYQLYEMGPEAGPADILDLRSENNTKAHPGDPLYWRTVCAVCRFAGGELAEVSLHPVESGHGKPRAQRGRPMLAEGETAREILERMVKLSRPFDTEVAIEDMRGVVRGRTPAAGMETPT